MRIAIPILVLAARCYAAGCTGYGNFITFTYDPSGAALSASLSNFPNLFNATDANLKTTGNGGKMMNNNGWDVCVSSVDDNTTYPLQIASYNGSTGALWFYFKPAITPKTSSTYHLWVGKDVASDPSSRTVWDSNYSEVYLLQENGAPNADTLNVYADSAQSGGKTLTGGKNPTPAVGIVGTAQSFNGVASAEYLPIAASLSTTNNASIFGVVNAVADSTSNLVVYDTRTSGCSGGYFIPYVDGSNGHAKCITDGGGKSVDGGVDIRNATHTLACVLDAGTLRLYVDGVSAGTPQPGASFGGGGGTPAIGKACGTGAGAGHFKGTIQNFSISNTGRSADWEKLEAYQILHPLVAITAVGLSSNKPTITSFSCTPTVAEGSATTCTFTVANATSTVVSGACPWSFNGCHYTGASPATFTPEFNTAFQLTATNEYGATISAPAYVTVTRPGASAANPVLTNVSVANSSSTSVRFTASSDTPAEWSGRCGTAAGPSGTVVPTPVLWARANGPAPHGYAIMNITFAITGLSPSTHYHCYATATNDRGSTTTSDQQITTGAAETTTPFRVSFPSPHTRLNGQFNGEYGMTLTGKMTDGDTDYWTWADDGMEYGLYQDGKGVQGGQTPAIGMIRWAPGNPPVPTQLATVTPFSGTATSENGVLSLRGVQYGFFLYHGYGGVTCCFNVIKSLDHWTTSQSPQTGGANGPNVANVAGVDQPTISTGTISGSSWSSGTMTLTVGAWGTGNVPPANTQVDVAGSTNCDGSYVVTASSANTVAFAHANASCSAGTVKFMHSMTPGCGAAGAPSACISTNGGAYWLISPIQPCQDYSQNCVFRANMDGWVYFHALYNGIVAVRVEDLYLQDITKWRVYKGVQGTNDFQNDPGGNVAWGPITDTITNLAGTPYGNALTSANKLVTFYDPFFKRFGVMYYVGSNICAGGSAIYDLGPYPTGIPVYAGGIGLDPKLYPHICPGFPNPRSSTEVQLSANPLTTSMQVVTSGGSFRGPDQTDGSRDSYAANLITGIFTDRTAPVASKPIFGPKGFVGDHARVLYRFLDGPGSTTLASDADVFLAGGASFSASGLAPQVKTQFGLQLGYPGVGDETATGYTWTGNLFNTAVSSGYSEAIGTSSTTFACWGHYPYKFTPHGRTQMTINDGAANETVVKGGDLLIQRNGSTFGAAASWNVYLRGSLMGAVPLADGTFGCIAVVSSGTGGSQVKVYQSDAITNATGVGTPTLTGTASAASSGGTVVFGDTTHALLGSVALFSVNQIAFTDEQLIQQFDAIGVHMLSLDPVDKTARIAGH